MNLRYDELDGSETARASDSAAAEFRRPRYTRKPTASVEGVAPLKFAEVAHGGTLPFSADFPEPGSANADGTGNNTVTAAQAAHRYLFILLPPFPDRCDPLA